MPSKSEELDKIYTKAKDSRIVLNKEEFAKKLGYSRIHLYRLLAGNNEKIVNELITKAKKLLNVTSNVSHEQTKEQYLMEDEAPYNISFPRLVTLLEQQQATIQSQQQTIHYLTTKESLVKVNKAG